MRRTPPPTARVAPRWAYPPWQGRAITSLHHYEGRAWPALAGSLIFADGSSGHVWRLSPEGRQGPELLFTVPGGVTALGADAAGELLLTAWDGHLYRLD